MAGRARGREPVRVIDLSELPDDEQVARAMTARGAIKVLDGHCTILRGMVMRPNGSLVVAVLQDELRAVIEAAQQGLRALEG
jgi:hypothetical protein